MAEIIRGTRDKHVKAIAAALRDYEAQFPGSEVSVYRQNPGVIRVRVIDDRFEGMPRSRRHNDVWQFLSKRVGDDVMGEISALLLLPTGELRSSLANLEFEDPQPSRL